MDMQLLNFFLYIFFNLMIGRDEKIFKAQNEGKNTGIGEIFS